MKGKTWTKEEDEILRQNYVNTKKCMELLPNRTFYSIEHKRFRLGLKSSKETRKIRWSIIKNNRDNKVDKRCEHCNNIFKIYKSEDKLRNRRFCSLKCVKIKFNGSNHGNWKGGLRNHKTVCPQCNNEFNARIIYKTGKIGKYCSSSCSNASKFRLGVFKKKGTNIEIMVEKLLKSKKVKYESQKLIKLPNKTYTIVDFYLIKKNTCLYADGDYWHSRPGVKKRDQYQNRSLRRMGFKVVRLKGSSILNNKPILEGI